MNQYTANISRDLAESGLEIMSFEVLHIVLFDGIAQRAHLLLENEQDAFLNMQNEEEMLARAAGKRLEIHSYSGRLFNRPKGHKTMSDD